LTLGRYVLTATVTVPGGVSSYGASGPVTTTPGTATSATPGALTVIATQALAPGDFLLSWTATLQTAAAGGDANNFGLYGGASGTTLLATSVNPGTVGSYPQAAVPYYTGVTATINVKNIAAGSTGSVYNGSLTVTPLASGDNKGAVAWTGAGSPPGWSGGSFPVTFLAGTPLWLDSAGELYAAIGSANLRAWIDGTDAVGHGQWACLGNLGEDAVIIQPAVPATSPAGLTNTAANPTGNTAYVTVGANGATMANYWVNAVSVATTATAFMMAVPAGGTCALQYTVAVPVWFWSECTPALPASPASVVNTTGRNLSVVFCGGGAVSAITINGLTTNIVQAPGMQPNVGYTGGTPLPAGATIVVTYTGTVAWSWLDPLDLVLTHSDGNVYSQANTVAPSGAAGYSPLNTLPYAAHAEAGMPGWGIGVSN
jgi:hypothetical protein